MYGSFVSNRSIEVAVNDDSIEVEFEFNLVCVNLSTSGQFSGPPEHCYEAEAAEFELDSIFVIDAEGNPHNMSENALVAIIGPEVFQKMLEGAEAEADESGEF